MNKFRKLLVLMLVLAVCASVFAVVASAAGDEPALEKSKASIGSYMTYETKSEGDLAESNPDGAGHFEIVVAEDGNKYIKHHVSSGTGNASYAGNGYQCNKTYSITEYPYLVFDFDIAKLEGDYAGAGFNPYYYGNGPVYDDFGKLSTTLSQVTGGNLTVKLSTFKKYLPQEYNTWAHVTIIFKYHIMDDCEYIGYYVYVNGQKVAFSDSAHTVNTEYLASNYYFGTFRINNDGGTNTKNFSGYDNWQLNVYNGAYTMDEVVAEVYTPDYVLPYGNTIAKIGDVPFDTIPKAIKAYKPGDVITLLSDIEGVISIETPVTFDTNKYDANGNPTGQYYNITTTSTKLLSSSEDGILSFKQVQNASVEVYWDDCPGVAAGGECACPSEYLDEEGNHMMSVYTPSAMLNSIPVYTGTVPEFAIENGISKKFVGWSYTQGGPVEDIRAIGTDDVNEGWIALYPVYETLQYNIEVISAAGDSSYYLEDELATAIAAAGKNAVVKFHTDVAASGSIELSKKTFTIDLNGFSLKNAPYVEVYNAEQDGSGNWVKSGNAISTSGETVALGFSVVGAGEFSIISSRPGASIYNVKPKVVRLISDGEVVDQSVTVSYPTFISYKSAVGHTVNIKGDITVYTGAFIYNDWDSNTNAGTLNVEDATFYCVSPKDAVLFRYNEGSTHNYKNSKFYFNSIGSTLSNYGKKPVSITTITMENCVLYADYNANAGGFTLDEEGDSMSIINCRIFSKNFASDKATLGDGTYLAYGGGTPVDGYEKIDSNQEFEFYPTSSVTYSVDASGAVVYGYNIEKTVGTAIYYVFDPNKGPTNVTFKDLEGNVINSFVANKNSTVTAPEYFYEDGWRKVTNILWVDAEGNPASLTLGGEDSYEFSAKLPEVADREYAASMSVAMMNMAYYSRFAYNLYVPVTEGVEIVSIGAEAPEAIALIDGAKYYVLTVYVDVNSALDDYSVDVVYVIDEQQYTATLTLNAYVYAMGSVADPSHTAEDKEASGALIRYIEESYKYAANGAALSAAVQEKLDKFYAEYTPADYVTEYPAGELHEINVDAVSGLIEYMSFRVWGGSRIDFAVALTDEAVALGYKVSFGEAEVNADADGKVYYTDGSALYASLMNPVYNITVVDAEGNAVSRDLNEDGEAETVATTNYSMASYIVAMEDAGYDVDIVKALYALGKAALAVRNNNVA